MRVALTGASGLIGSAVARTCAGAGHKVLRIARRPAELEPLSGATDVSGDLRDPAGWISALGHCDALIHCGCDWSGDPARTDATVLDAVLSSGFSGRLTYTGGVWSFGNQTSDITEETPLHPHPDFAWMMAGWDRLMTARADAVLVHPALVWRAGHPPCPELSEGRLPGPGTQRWALVHADDLAEGYRLALERGKPGRAYLFASEHALARDLAPTADLVALPHDPDNPWCWDQHVTTTRALAELGWTPHYTNAVKTLGNSAKP